MVFTIFIGLLFGFIVFFHYLQGFFSATLSAILAVVAAVLAFSWHETIVEKLLQGRAANIAHAMVLVALFAGIYMVLRIIFDKAIPEGVTLPNAIDRAGGAIMGALAATFTLGILSIAAQELPLGAAVGGYTKYETADTNAQIQTGGVQMQQGFTFDNLHAPDAGRFDESDRRQMFPIVPAGVDEIVVNTVYHLSESGSLQGSQPLSDVHPDFLQELFGQRIGIQGGAQHVTMNRPGQPGEPPISINTQKGLFLLPEARIVDGEMPDVRRQPIAAPLKVVKWKVHGQEVDEFDWIYAGSGATAVTEKVKYAFPGTDKDNGKEVVFFVVRVMFGPDAADNGELVRISPGAIRLYAKKADKNGTLQPFNYYPIGTLERGAPYPILYLDKPDDFIFVPLKGRPGETRTGIDVVFAVDKDTFLTGDKKNKVQDGAFIELKRLVREEIGGKTLNHWAAPDASVGLSSLHQKTWHEPVTASGPIETPAK